MSRHDEIKNAYKYTGTKSNLYDGMMTYSTFLGKLISLNGFHAFPDKEAAYRETYRVLKPGGTFCGCFYVKHGCARTDWFIRNLYQPKGFFTAPYETETSLRDRLSGMYGKADVSAIEGIACFCCVKQQ